MSPEARRASQASITLALTLALSNTAAQARADGGDEPASAEAAETPEARAETDQAGDRDEGTLVGHVKITRQSQAAGGLICKLERPPGSRIPRKVCRTAQEIVQDRADGKRRIRATQIHQSRRYFDR